MIPKLIAISSPFARQHEADEWKQLFDLGLTRLHVRKPSWSVQEVCKLLDVLPENCLNKLVIHHHVELAKKYPVAGVHVSFSDRLNHIKSELTAKQSLSVSVHHWGEAEQNVTACDYQLIAPVFNSISKTGYLANPSLVTVPDNLKHKNMYALGGVQADNLNLLNDMGYCGAAVLGALWNEDNPIKNWIKFKQKLL